MNDSFFDEAVRKKLDRLATDVPAGMWDRIMAEKKKRRPGFFLLRYFLIIIILLPLLFGAYYMFLSNRPATNSPTNFPVQAEQLPLSTNKSDRQPVSGGISKSNDKIIEPGLTLRAENSAQNRQSQEMHPRRISRNSKSKETTISVESLGKPASVFNDPEIKNAIDTSALTPTANTNPTEAKKTFKTDSAQVNEPIKLAMDEDKFSLELFASPILPVNRIRSANKSYENLLQNAARMQPAFNIGFRLKYHFSEKIAAKVGLQYTRSGSRFNLSDSSGNQYGKKNVYSNFSVPLLFTYKTGWLSSGDLSLNTGLLVNIVSKYRGMVPNASGQPISLSSNEVYDKNTSASIYISIDYSKVIGERSAIFAEPWFAYRLKSMTNRMYGFDQRIHNGGISIGWRYRLFKKPVSR